MEYRLQKLAEYIRGWMGYFRITEYYRPISRLDQWIRRRIRCCFIKQHERKMQLTPKHRKWLHSLIELHFHSKQWRKAENPLRNLVRLGVDHIKAAMIAASSKGYYRLSKTFAVQQALNDSYLANLGLVSRKDLWVKFNHRR